MRVPNYIKTAIRRAGYHDMVASKNNRIVREWIDKVCPGENDGKYDPIIDSIEMGVNEPEGLIRQLESGEISEIYNDLNAESSVADE